MTTFQSINIRLGPSDHASEATTPTTPRAPLEIPPLPQPSYPKEESASTTPTRQTFAGPSSKRALPVSPFSNSFPLPQQPSSQSQHSTLSREDSQRSAQSNRSQDVDMDDSEDGEDGSDAESVDEATGRPSKKKKGQRFFCTEFPPCSLSFTRSEHLARHIRKHTGERPFQCHCSRRFSRLDNLRQHAQTVHVNEEIPGDSLAATGTRFQRQIRTDRVRPPGSRSRASTAGSQGGQVRGHGRNLSTSSIGSNASTVSRDDNRRRPPPLMMAHDSAARARLSVDTMRGQISTPPGSYTYVNPPSGGPSTPTSITYSNGPSSPYDSHLGSPISSVSRNFGLWSGRATGRRLSVPSGPNPFQPPNRNVTALHFSPLAPSNASNNSSNSSSLLTSPTSSTYSFSRDSGAIAEADWRRRTWHPSTYTDYPRPATSGLMFYQTPDAPRPAFAPQAVAAAGQPQRLPGIETFDHRPQTPPRGDPSPMQVDAPTRPPFVSGSSSEHDRRGHASWDMSLHQNLTKLDIANGTPPREPGAWGKQVIAEMHNAATASSYGNAPQQPSQLSNLNSSQESQKRQLESDHYPRPITPSRSKRNGWYNGPLPAPQQARLIQRTSPEDSSSSDGVPTPSTTSVDYHPLIVNANGYIENTTHTGLGIGTVFNGYNTANNQVPAYPVPSDAGRQLPKANDMSGLEALVAVATSEEKAPAATNN